jgi:hypothetical protein
MRAASYRRSAGQEERMRKMGITDVKRIYTEKDSRPARTSCSSRRA